MPSAKKRQKLPVSDAIDSSAASGSASGSDSDSDSEFNSGYSSNNLFDSKAKYYQKVRAKFVVAGLNLANPCNEIKAMMKKEENLWNLHCKETRKGDPVAALKAAIAEDFKTVLVWRRERKNSRIKREATISTY
ncbi:hypothetical protein DL95DRAFT_418548 [Leptodontidium sp. 2 PMI_412]|nr:hypothetical protein DL95DRAFT_418548 [Leptodontidium sp. 2 PMI_412]